MTFTYGGDPANSALEQVRFLIGDTDSTRPLLNDAEIQYVIDTWDPLFGSTTLNAAVCCEVIAGNYAREISISADGVTVGLSELQGKFDMRATSLRDQYKQEAQMASPSFDGVMFDLAWDESIKPLKFGTGFMDNYLAGRQNYGDYDPSERPGFNELAPGY